MVQCSIMLCQFKAVLVFYSIFQYTIVCCSILQYIIVYCGILQQKERLPCVRVGPATNAGLASVAKTKPPPPLPGEWQIRVEGFGFRRVQDSARAGEADALRGHNCHGEGKSRIVQPCEVCHPCQACRLCHPCPSQLQASSECCDALFVRPCANHVRGASMPSAPTAPGRKCADTILQHMKVHYYLYSRLHCFLLQYSILYYTIAYHRILQYIGFETSKRRKHLA